MKFVSISAIPTMSSTVSPLYQNFIASQFLSPLLLLAAGADVLYSRRHILARPLPACMLELQSFRPSKTQRKITCLQCAKQSMLIPRGYFEVDITDSSGAPTAVVSEALAETMLSITAEQVYDTVATKHESPPVAQINRKFGHRLFKIQLHRPPFRIPDQKINTLAISSFSEKEPTLQESLPVPTFLGEASKKFKGCNHFKGTVNARLQTQQRRMTCTARF